MTIAQLLLAGSRKVSQLTTLGFVEPLYVKGFPLGAILNARYIPNTNSIYFYVYETANEALNQVIYQEAIFDCASVTPPVSTAINAYTLSVVSKTGGVMLIKLKVDTPEYVAFTSNAAMTILSETLEFLDVAGASVAVTLNNQTQTTTTLAKTIFDDAYYSALARNVILSPVIEPFMKVYLSEGFNTGKSWVRIHTDAVKDRYLSVASNSNAGALIDFGAPVRVLKNVGTVENPIYTLGTDPAAEVPIPNKYWFSMSSYTATAQTTTAAIPYLVAKSKDTSGSLAFSVTPDIVGVADGVSEFTFGGDTLALLFMKTGAANTCLGGAATGALVRSPYDILLPKRILGVKVLSATGVTLTNARLRQQIVNGSPVLSVSENNPTNDAGLYGAAVSVKDSGTYQLRTPLGGMFVVTTNSLFYDLNFEGSETLAYSYSEDKIFSELTPSDYLSGRTEYRCIALKNTHPSKTFARVKLWLELNCNSPFSSVLNHEYLQLAKTSELIQIPNSSTAPLLAAGGELGFSFIDAESSSFVVDNMLPDQETYIWFKRVCNPQTQPTNVVDILSFIRLKVYY